MGISILVCGFQGLGQILAGRIPDKLPDQRLFLTTDGCEVVNGTIPPIDSIIPSEWSNPWKKRDDSWEVQIWSISYAWLPGIGIGTTIIFGLIFSGIISLAGGKQRRIEKRLFAFPLLSFWKRVLGQKYLESWIEMESLSKTPPFTRDEKF